jgi:hypothetical protein
MNKVTVSLNNTQMFEAIKWCRLHCDNDWDTEQYEKSNKAVWQTRTKEEWITFMCFYENGYYEFIDDIFATVTFIFKTPQKALHFKLIFG